MTRKGAATGSGGSGLLIGGIGFVIAIIAGAMLLLNPNERLTEEELSGLVQPSSVNPTTTPVASGSENAQVSDTVPEASAAPESRGEAAAGNDMAVDDAGVVQKNAAQAPVAAPQAKGQTGEAQSAEPQKAPSIDEVRLDREGVAVIAGRAAPGSSVDVIVDGDVVASARADASGSFAALGVISPSEKARVLSLDAEGTRSRDEVILTPVPAAPAPAPAETGNVSGEVSTAQAGAAAQPAAAGQGDGQSAGATPVPQPAAEQKQTAAVETAPTAQTAQTTALASASTSQKETDTTDAQTPQVTVQPPLIGEGAAAPAPAEPPRIAMLKSSEEGVALLPEAPAPPSQIVLDTIGYSDSGVVQLSGRASEQAAQVRVYINNRSIATLNVDAQGNWRGNVPDIDTGIYTLRVDAVDAAGDVTSRIETPFKREAPEVLAAASAGATGPVSAITVQTGDTLWAIARDRYGEGVLYVRVFEANRSSIRDPDLIYPGQVFDLPSE